MIELSEWLNNQKQLNRNLRQLLQERIQKAYPRRKLTAEETKRLAKLEAIADKLKRGENVQNRQLKTWLSQDEIDLICFGRPFISNPDLVEKLQDKIPLMSGDESTFYGGNEKGYIDY